MPTALEELKGAADAIKATTEAIKAVQDLPTGSQTVPRLIARRARPIPRNHPGGRLALHLATLGKRPARPFVLTVALLIILMSASTATAATGNRRGRHHHSHRALNAARHGAKRTHDHSRAPTAGGPSPAGAAAPSAPSPAPIALCANADIIPDPTNLPVAAAAALCLVNQVRAQHGIPPLIDDSTLDQAAQRHNNDMVARDYFAHDSPAGDTPLSRVRDAGYLTISSSGYSVAENLAAATPSLSTPGAIVNSWVGSPEHLANMLDPRFRDSGIAVAAATPTLVGREGGGTYTQDFGGPGSG